MYVGKIQFWVRNSISVKKSRKSVVYKSLDVSVTTVIKKFLLKSLPLGVSYSFFRPIQRYTFSNAPSPNVALDPLPTRTNF